MDHCILTAPILEIIFLRLCPHSAHRDTAKPDPVIVLVILRYLLMNSLIPQALDWGSWRDKA